MKLQSLEEAYLNISGNMYPNDYINLARIKDNQIAFNQETLFLSEEVKEILNKDEIKKLKNIVIIFKLEGAWGILCNVPIKYYKKKKILCHELVLSDVIQRMLSNFHYYNSEANPVILTHDKKLNLETFVENNKEVYKLENDQIELFVYSGKEANKILKELEEVKYFYIADGHHRLYTTSLYLEKETVMSCIYEIDQMNIEPIPRKIVGIEKEKFEKFKNKIQNKFKILDNDKKLEKSEIRLTYEDETITFKLIESAGDLFANNDIYRLNTQVISNIFRIFKEDEVEFLSMKELKKELEKQQEKTIYLEMSSMDKNEFISTIENGNIMPPKSTYFRPKFPSFLVFNFFRKKLKDNYSYLEY